MAADCLIIVNENFDVLGLDKDAEATLRNMDSGRNGAPGSARLPRELLRLLEKRSGWKVDDKNLTLTIGSSEYSCRMMWVRPAADSPCQRMLAIYLRQELSVADAVLQAASEYHLTEREQEALIGVIMGLTSKEVAHRMDISPNTVKTFLRLIMIKMGVPTRAAIVGRLFDQTSGTRKFEVTRATKMFEEQARRNEFSRRA